MKQFIMLLSGLCLLVIACNKKNNGIETPPPNNNTALLKAIVYQSLPSPYYHFEYDGEGRVNKASFASGAFTYSLLYGNNGVKEMKSILATTKINASYQYDDKGRIGFVKISSEDGSQVFKRAFLNYDNQNRLTELEWELNTAAGFAVQRTLSFVYDAAGNLLEKIDHRHFMEGRQEEATYIDRFEQYDDKLNVDDFTLLHETSEHLVLFPGIKLQHGNPMKVIRTGSGTNYEISYSYSYSTSKQPVKRTGTMLITNGPQAGQTFPLVADYSYYN